MKKYLFVINPVSGGSNKSALKEEIKKRGNDQNRIEFYETTGENDLNSVNAIVQDFKPDVIAIAGGDGTITELSAAVQSTPILLSIIPTGSANGLATALDIRMNNALDIAFGHQSLSLDIVEINGHRMLHMADIGLNASLVRRYESEERRGFLGYAISAIQELPTLSENFKVSIGGQTYETNFLIIANAKKYGTGYEVNPLGKLDDHQVELCILKEISTEAIIKQFFADENGNDHQLFDILQGDNFHILCDQKVDFQVDGEYLGKVNELKVRVLPEQISVLV